MRDFGITFLLQADQMHIRAKTYEEAEKKAEAKLKKEYPYLDIYGVDEAVEWKGEDEELLIWNGSEQ